jgi:hypothetical protein
VFFSSEDAFTSILINDSFVELATRMIWLQKKAKIATDPGQRWRLGGLLDAAVFAQEYDFESVRSLKRFFRMLPESAYHLLYNPLCRQLGTRIPGENFAPGHSIVAMEVLSRINIVGHKNFFTQFTQTLTSHLGLEVDVPPPPPVARDVSELADKLRTIKEAKDMVVFDAAINDAVYQVIEKNWK